MKTTVYFRKLASFAGPSRRPAPSPDAGLSGLPMTSYLLRDIGMRRGPVGPDGSDILPF